MAVNVSTGYVAGTRACRVFPSPICPKALSPSAAAASPPSAVQRCFQLVAISTTFLGPPLRPFAGFGARNRRAHAST